MARRGEIRRRSCWALAGFVSLWCGLGCPGDGPHPSANGGGNDAATETACTADADCGEAVGSCGGKRCVDDRCVLDYRPQGFKCGDGVCDGGGHCVTCAVDAHCDSGKCLDNVCLSPNCTDEITNGLETDGDCGGPSCPSCLPGEDCLEGTDCSSGVCAGESCQAPTCDDGVLNGDESDIDCGGSCATDCAAGSPCGSALDCISASCVDSLCQPSCHDGMVNGSESDTDCGGSCDSCPSGAVCSSHGDCTGANCDPALLICLLIISFAINRGAGRA